MGWAELDSSTQILYVAAGFGVVGAGLLALRQLRKRRKKARKEDYKKDMVYLYATQRHRIHPCLSAPNLKMETWLRMAGVKYEYVGVGYTGNKSKYGQLPFVELNGTEISDSNLIVQRLARHFDADLDADLSSEQQAMGLAVTRMVEEHTNWNRIYYILVDRVDLSCQLFGLPGPRIFHWYIRRQIKKQYETNLRHRGISRHSKTEIYQLGNTDIRALSTLLGDKPFFMGSKPSTVDAAVFGVLAQVVYLDLPSPHKQVIVNSCRNLLDYCDRIKDQFYPDWAELCAQGE